MSAGKEAIAEEFDTEPHKVKCKNCIALEQHGLSNLLKYDWCDFWSTTIDDSNTAYCSFFTPSQPQRKGEDEHAG